MASTVQIALEAAEGVLVQESFLKKAFPTFTGFFSPESAGGYRSHGQQGHFLHGAQGALGTGVEQTHFLNDVAEKFQTHRPLVAGGIDVQNIATPGEISGTGRHLPPLEPPLHRLLRQQFRREFHADAQCQFMLVEKIAGHESGQQVIWRHDETTGAVTAQGE